MNLKEFKTFKEYSESVWRWITYIQSCLIEKEDLNTIASWKAMFGSLGERSHIHTTQYIDAAMEVARVIWYQEPEKEVTWLTKKWNFNFDILFQEGSYDFKAMSIIKRIKGKLFMNLQCDFYDNEADRKNTVELFMIGK